VPSARPGFAAFELLLPAPVPVKPEMEASLLPSGAGTLWPKAAEQHCHAKSPTAAHPTRLILVFIFPAPRLASRSIESLSRKLGAAAKLGKP